VNLQAEQLNKVLQDSSPQVFDMLSERGKSIYFPHQGILGQGAAAKGKKYNATIGIAFEDDLSPMHLNTLDQCIDLDPASVYPYASSFGNPKLRSTWKQMLLEKNPSLASSSFSNPVVTQALTHGLSLAGFMLINPGDEILLPAPFWDNYSLLFEQGLGATLKSIPCFTDQGRFDVDALSEQVDRREGGKVTLLLNFPNNPTGYTPLLEEYQAIVTILAAAADKGTQIIVLIDDAYFGLVYEEGVATESIFGLLANLHPNILAVKIDGATKEDYAWGLRVGFISFANPSLSAGAYTALEDKAAGTIRAMISNCSQLSQSLLLKAYHSDEYHSQKQQKYELLKSRYQVIKALLAKHPEYAAMFTALPYNSGYFMCIQPTAGIDSEALRQLLLDKYETGVIELEGLIRIAFSALPADQIPTVFANIYRACAELLSPP